MFINYIQRLGKKIARQPVVLQLMARVSFFTSPRELMRKFTHNNLYISMMMGFPSQVLSRCVRQTQRPVVPQSVILSVGIVVWHIWRTHLEAGKVTQNHTAGLGNLWSFRCLSCNSHNSLPLAMPTGACKS